MKLTALRSAPVVGLLAAWSLASVAGAGAAAGQSLRPDSLDDGPHVYWRNDSTAFAFYHCRGTFRSSDWFRVKQAVAMGGFCGDTAVTYVLASSAPQPEPDVFDGVSKIFAVSDVHGEYDALVDLLVNAGIVREDLSWAWGDGHLVIVGDVFDRGDRVTECLWLIHRLEREAHAAGGRVHFLLGNHEIMVMQGDLRYVNGKYLKGVVATSGVDYQDLFGPAMELGRWLRTRNTVVRLNDVLFVHAGLGPEVVERDLDMSEINAQVRGAIDLRSYDLIFNDMPGFLLESDGPLWYRRYHGGTATDPGVTPEELQTILDHFGGSAVVVGHTDIGVIQALHEGKVYGIDVALEELGAFQGLLWERGTFYRVGTDGAREAIGGGH